MTPASRSLQPLRLAAGALKTDKKSRVATPTEETRLSKATTRSSTKGMNPHRKRASPSVPKADMARYGVQKGIVSTIKKHHRTLRARRMFFEKKRYGRQTAKKGEKAQKE